jgi:hypothetical protein
MGAAGLKLPTQVARFCGASISVDDVERHIYTAHIERTAA